MSTTTLQVLEPLAMRLFGPPGAKKLTKQDVARFTEAVPDYLEEVEAANEAKRRELLLAAFDCLIGQARQDEDDDLALALEAKKGQLDEQPPRTEAEWERAEEEQRKHAIAFGWEADTSLPKPSERHAGADHSHAPLAVAVSTTVQRGRGEARPGSRSTSRSSSRGGDGGDGDSESSEPPHQARRLCENKRCEADISHRPTLARYCNDACQQEAYRDRLTHEHLDELVGTAAIGLSCGCTPKGHLVIDGVCFTCGRARGAITRAWLSEARDLRSHQIVARAPAQRNPRYGDRKRKPVTKRKAVAA